jgi:hypothetical protein
MSRPSSPAAKRARLAASFDSRASAASATCRASAAGTTTTPSMSATITSPGCTSAPAHTTGTLTEPSVALIVPLAWMARLNTGKFIAFRSRTSRTPPSITRPLQPRALNEVASRSPKKPSVLSLVQAATTTSPGRICSAATCSIQLSPGCSSAVTAGPQKRASGWIGRMRGCISPSRPSASCTVDTP